MKKKEKQPETRLFRVLTALGIASFVLAAVLIVLMIIMNIEKVHDKYEQYLVIFENLEHQVASLNSRWLILIVIVLLFLLRSLSWIYPLTIVYFISAMVYTPIHSFIINLLCTLMLCAIRYYTGIQMGEGFWVKFLRKRPMIYSVIETKGKFNPYTLFALRFVPFVPFNMISHIYGSFEYPFWKFLLISAGACIPRLISYSFIGRNVYDPLSTKFFLPLAFLLVLTGVSLFTLKVVINFGSIFRRNKTNNENK